VPAIVHRKAPELAVTMYYFGTFDVTHLETGMTIFTGTTRSEVACNMLANWALIAHICGFSWGEIKNDQQSRDLAQLFKKHRMPSGELISEYVANNRTVGSQPGGEFPWEDESPTDLCFATLELLPEPLVQS